MVTDGLLPVGRRHRARLGGGAKRLFLCAVMRVYLSWRIHSLDRAFGVTVAVTGAPHLLYACFARTSVFTRSMYLMV